MQRIIVRDKQLRKRAADLVGMITSDPLQEVIIRDYRKDKSAEQLGYLFGVVLKTLSEFIEDSGGEHWTTDELYGWMADEYCDDKVVTVDGKPKVVKVTASKMNTKQMHEFIERIVRHAAEMGCAIPPPEYRD